jgi:para-nitrobenzyl esterase
VRGAHSDEAGARIDRFLGMPYGRPPFGDLRFAAPQPVEGWDGVRDALAFGPTAPKPDAEHSQGQLDFLEDPMLPGDDCLNLNVLTPATEATGLPVMVWIHGGAFIAGSSAQPIYDGTAFARDGVVFVSMNYRLGVEGFALLPDAPANRGVLDLLLALEWVRDNVAAFGGDPSNVTVFGESAGAGLVLALMALDRGLFRRAIIQSAALIASVAPADAALVAAEVAARAGVAPTAEGFRGVDPQRLANFAKLAFLDVAANPDPRRWGVTTVTAGMPFGTSHDGELLTGRPLDLVLGGAGSGVELMLSSTSEEMLAMVASGGPGGDETVERGRKYLAYNGASEKAIDVYLDRVGTPSAALAAAMTDVLFRIPAIRIADSRKQEATFSYEFAWPSPLPGVGAAHGLDLGFTFDTLGNSPLEGADPPKELATAVHRACIDFAAKGDPGWSAYKPDSRSVMVFGDESGVVNDPRAAERRVFVP